MTSVIVALLGFLFGGITRNFLFHPRPSGDRESSPLRQFLPGDDGWVERGHRPAPALSVRTNDARRSRPEMSALNSQVRLGFQLREPVTVTISYIRR
jgi:hypothetical protein